MLQSVEERVWSIFPLVEFIPLGFAVLISSTIGLPAWFSPMALGIAGLAMIALSYVHFVNVLMVAGYVRSRK